MNHTRRTTTIRPARRALAATLTVAALAATACAGDDDATPATTQAASASAGAGTVTPTTRPALAMRVLRVAHIDGGSGLDPATGWFADALAQRSGGVLTAEFRHDCCGSDADNEQTLLEQVRSGEADLGWVGVRAFAQAGTTAFEPLITPLLIRSYAAEQTVIESEVANGVLAQLEPLGLVGLGLMPGGLRFPMSTGVPLTTPADWVGQPFYTFESQVALAAVAALGADPQHVGFEERDQGLDDGSIIGLDNTVRFQTDRLDVFTHLVADMPLWTRMSALVAASTTEFTVEEQRWIAEAVADTAGRTAELGDVDREAADEACTVGDPGYALAGPDGIATFEAALAPVAAEVGSEAGDPAMLEALHELVAGIPAETPVTCEGAAGLADTSGVTLRTLIETPAEAPALEGAGDAATGTFPVTYMSGGLTISARMSLPAGSGPFPAVVLVQPFGGLERDVDRLVGSGYVVLDADLRGNGNSDPDPSEGTDLEMGSTLDVINAARALAADPRVDSSRVALVGSGLGGLIAINAQVVAPDVVAAVVAENPSSLDVWQNIEYFFEPDDEFRSLIVDPRGTPEENPELWADVSPATFVDRVDSPLLILQGTGDTGNDPAWSDATVATFTAAGKSAEVITFDGADAALVPSQEEAIAATESFLAASL
jgi:TRAP-type C4-dicarboxylate transport system substrate-binding protein/dienelactone hydrolase